MCSTKWPLWAIDSYFLPLFCTMLTELTNGFGKVYLTIEYDGLNHWVYNNWLGYQTYESVTAGANACLHPLSDFSCPYLLNDNRQVLGPWDHALKWIAIDWAPRAIAQGLTHFAHVVGPESMAAVSAEAMQMEIGGRLHMRLFDTIEQARDWLREARLQKS